MRLINAEPYKNDRITANSEDAGIPVKNPIPTVDAVPVVHGRWIADIRGQHTMVCHCSVCSCQKALLDGNFTMFKYCSECGSKMDGEPNGD